MPCVQNPRSIHCGGPEGPAEARCGACRHKAFVAERRVSLDGRARRDSVDGLALVGRWSENIDTLLGNMHQAFLAQAEQQPPCQYAFILCGSAARNEASPYSDLDCAMLIADGSESNVNYFWRMCAYIGKQVALLGERMGESKGLRYCDGGCNPLGLKGGEVPDARPRRQVGGGAFGALMAQVQYGVELIRTPEGMAALQEMTEDHTRESLLETRFCFGTEALHVAYRGEVATIQGARQPEWSWRPLLRKRKREALGFFNEVVTKFTLPDANADKWKLKEGFYRPAQFTTKALAYWYGVDMVSTSDQIRGLQAAGRLHATHGQRLLAILEAVSKVRVISQLEARGEVDEVWTHEAAARRPGDAREKQLTEAETRTLRTAIGQLEVNRALVLEFVRQKKKKVGKRKNPFSLVGAVNDAE